MFQFIIFFFALSLSLSFCYTGTNTASSGSNGVISFSTPNSFQQYYSPTFGQFGAVYAATLLPSGSGTTPQVQTNLKKKKEKKYFYRKENSLSSNFGGNGCC